MYLLRSKEGEGTVILELDEACQLFHCLYDSGSHVIHEFIKGLIQEVDNSGHLLVLQQVDHLLWRWQLVCRDRSKHTPYSRPSVPRLSHFVEQGPSRLDRTPCSAPVGILFRVGTLGHLSVM